MDVESVIERHKTAYRRDLVSWRNTGYVAGIQIKPSPSASCERANRYAGCYRIEDAPDYPFGPCDHHEIEDVCTCGWSPIFDDETGGVVWTQPLRRHSLAGPSIRPDPAPMTAGAYAKTAAFLGIKTPGLFIPPKQDGPVKRFLLCTLLKRHNWRYMHLNDEGEKVFECRRCRKLYIAPR